MFRIAYSVFLCAMILWSGGDHSKKQGVQIRHSDEAEQERGCCRFFCRRYRFSRDARIREDARQQRRKNGYINDIPRACINYMALCRHNAREIVCSARFALKNKALKGSSNTAFAFGGMLLYFADLIIRRLGYDFKRVCGVADGRTGGFRRRGE